ncbi:hypothetical protein BDK51DRAFT_26709, partial [Blyttiomyces helicus]
MALAAPAHSACLAVPPPAAGPPTNLSYAGYLMACKYCRLIEVASDQRRTNSSSEKAANGEQVRFAITTAADPLHWTPLNSGNPVLYSTVGTHGARDPTIVRMAWAPSAVWDQEERNWLVFLGGGSVSGGGHDASDAFFSKAEVYIDNGTPVIDTVIVRDPADGIYYQFSKDERPPSSQVADGKFVFQ